MNEIEKYNYDVVVITENEIKQHGNKFLQPNRSMKVRVTDKFKKDVETNPNRNEIAKNLFFFPDYGLVLGFNYIGIDENNMHTTEVFYYDPKIEYLQNLIKR